MSVSVGVVGLLTASCGSLVMARASAAEAVPPVVAALMILVEWTSGLAGLAAGVALGLGPCRGRRRWAIERRSLIVARQRDSSIAEPPRH
ncbi:MAG: hypothetical protein HY521_01990 [Proteobacteria bacterium]|nr:hypothetical protein [Pseudomonadota bacterium]